MDRSISDGPDGLLPLLVPVVGAALLLQYVLGLWTNLYGPPLFTPSTSLLPYELHFDTGIAVTLLGIVLLLAAVATRRVRHALLATVTLASILAAALFGQAFVGSDPNAPVDSLGMGVAFLVAFASVLGMAYFVYAGGRTDRPFRWPPPAE